MFDLNRSLGYWRERLAQSGRCRQEDIDELEEHLCEEMANLERIGLDGEEAFLLAARRLGTAESLGVEFEKVNGAFVWLHRLRWMALGVLVYLGITAGISVIRHVLILTAIATHLSPSLAGPIALLLSDVVAIVVAFLLFRRFARRHRGSLGQNRLGSLAQCMFVFGTFVCCSILPVGSSIVLARCITPDVWRDYLGLCSAWHNFAISAIVPLLLAAWLVRSPRWTGKLLCG
jgi:hypothetical protein